MAATTPSASPPRAVVETTDAVGRTRLAKLPLLAIPLVLWLFAWSFWALWGIFVPLMVLVLGRNPRSVWKEIATYLQYVLRVTAYLSLAVDPFPGYLNRSQPDYPVRLELEYPPTLSRWLALARVVLNGPLVIAGFALIAVMAVAALVQFVTVLARGPGQRASLRVPGAPARPPRPHVRVPALAHRRATVAPAASHRGGCAAGVNTNGPAWIRTRDRRIMSPLL